MMNMSWMNLSDEDVWMKMSLDEHVFHHNMAYIVYSMGYVVYGI